MRLRSAILAAAGLLLSGCGHSAPRTPGLAGVPMVSGARIIVQLRSCDPGANPDCAYQLVVTNPHYRSSQQFLDAERHRLRRLGWTGAYAPNGDEHTANSPNGRLHLTFATADGDLKGIDLGWIKRRRPVALALSRAIFNHSPTLSMLVQLGSS